MYKFTNGVVCFTEEDKENFLKGGLVLVEEKEEKVGEENNDRIIEKAHSGSDSKTRKISGISKRRYK